jgi:hypothetical protein
MSQFEWPDAPTFTKLSVKRVQLGWRHHSDTVGAATSLPAGAGAAARGTSVEPSLDKENHSRWAAPVVARAAPVPTPYTSHPLRTTARCGDAAAGATTVSQLYQQFCEVRERAELAEARVAALEAELAARSAQCEQLEADTKTLMGQVIDRDRRIEDLGRAVQAKARMARNRT